MTNQSTTLSLKRILWAFCFFLITPLFSPVLTNIIQNSLIATTFTTCLTGLLLLIQNWDLLEIHFERINGKVAEIIFFVIIGVLLISVIILFNSTFLHAYLPLIDSEALKEFSFFMPLILFIHTFIFAMNYVITFKCITDRLKLKHAEVVVILLSGFLYSMIFTVTYIPFNLISWLQGYLMYFVITLIISYLYNQTHSIIPGILSFAISLLIFNWILIF